MKKNEEATPRRHPIRRFTDRFRKHGALTPLSDFPADRCASEPSHMEFPVSMKKLRRSIINKKYVAILDKGWLELHQRKKVDTGGLSNAYRIDLAKVNLMHDEQRIVVRFQVEALLLKPTEGTFQNFKEAVHKHRLWRQEHKTHHLEPKASAARSTVTPTTDFRTWEMDGVCIRLLESIKEMNTMTLAVLEKSTKQLDEARTIAEELRRMNGGTATPVVTTTTVGTTTAGTTTPATTTTTVGSSAPNTVTSQAKATPTDTDEDSEDASEVSEQTQQELAQPVNEPEILYSLETVRSDFDVRRPMLGGGEMLHSLEADVEAASKRAVAKVKKVLEEPPKPKPDPRPKEKPNEAIPKKRRDCLPSHQPPSEGIGWKALVHMAIHKSGLPLSNYEPIGTLQLMCEELTWSSLLDLAAAQRLPEDRMSFVTAFAMSPYCCSAGRSRKPFNPVLGETFDYEEAGWKFHAEQVSHHPPISVGHAEHKNWTWWNTMHLDTSISKWSKTLELSVDTPIRLRLRHADGVEDYTWNKVRSKVENLTSAPEQRKISHEGLMHIRCSNNYTARLYFKKCKDPKELTGDILAPNDRICFRLQGTWDRRLIRQRTTGERETLFDSGSMERFPHFYGFSRFTLGLNEMEPGIPPTDSRYRQDMRALEQGNVEMATEAKEQLEKAQRSRAKGTQKELSLWFESQTDEMAKQRMFVANGRYWTAKKSGFDGYREKMVDLTG